MRNRQVRIGMAWHHPVIGDAAGRSSDQGVYSENARQVHAESRRPADRAGVPVTGGVVESRPAHALLKAAEDADLLGVGARGRGARVTTGAVEQPAGAAQRGRRPGCLTLAAAL